MKLEAIIDGARRRDWLKDADALHRRRSQRALTDNESAELLRCAKQWIADDEPDDAANVLFAGLILGESAFLSCIQKDGLLRLSRSSYAPGAVTAIVCKLLESTAAWPLAIREYLESVAHLHAIARDVREENVALREWLDSEREAGVKGALATLDWIFLKQAYEPRTADRTQSSRAAIFFPPEELAEGFSTILALYADQFGPLRGIPPIDSAKAAEGLYLSRLISGAHIAAFREWEFLVDRMAYRLTKLDEPDCFRLQAPSEEFHRALALGFIHTDVQRTLEARGWGDDRPQSFADLGRRLANEEWNRHFVKLVEDPTPRYTFEFPEQLLTMTAEIGELLLEERIALGQASRDLLASMDDVLGFRLAGSITMRDLVLVSRLLQILRCFVAEKLLKEAEEHLPTVLQSLVPVFERATLLRLFGFVIGNEKAREVLGLLLLDVSGHIDVQYRPLIPAGSAVLVPVNVFANSNIYRNPLVVSRRRLYEDGRVDPLSDAIRQVFEEQGFAARSHVPFSWNGVDGEVDVLVVADDILIAIECKNSLLPTGVHELMTSIDCIHTAADQLDRFGACLRDPAFRDELARNAGLAIPTSARLVTGIVMANRMLIGYRQSGHAVRGKYELEQFVTKGTVEMGSESKSFWLGESLGGEDIRRFFEEDITYEPQWRSMIRITARYEFNGCSVETERLGLSMPALARELGLKEAEAELLKQGASLGP